MQIEPVADTPHRHAPRSPSLVAQIKDIDARRPDFPGEHLIVLGVGVLLMLSGMRSRTVLRRTLITAAGTALIGRAASGTGGVARVARIVKRLG